MKAFEQIKENRNRLDQCAKHTFDGGAVKVFGAKYTCQSCGGKADLGEIGAYIRGYVACGGNGNDIWPGWYGK